MDGYNHNRQTKEFYFYLILFFLVYVNFGNFLNIILFNTTGNLFFSQVAPALKDVYLWGLSFLAILVFINQPVIAKRDIALLCLFIIYFVAVLISYFYSSADYSFKVYNFRRNVTAYLAIMTFMFLPVDTYIYNKAVKSLLYIGIIVCLFGLIEIFLPVKFWDNVIGLPKYWNSRVYIDVDYSSITETGGKAYTSDLIFLLGGQVRRMISSYAEATTLGSLFSFLFTYFSFSKPFKYQKIILTLFFVCGMLVFSKAFWLSVLIVFFYKYIKKPEIYPVIILSGVFVLSGYYVYNVLGKLHGSFSHFIGLYTGIEISFFKPFGLGLGVAGNRGQYATGVVNGLNGGESGLGNVLAQIGFSGFLTVLILFVILKKFQFFYKKTLNKEYFAIFVATVNWYFIYLLSASSLGFSGNIIFFIFIGLMLNKSILKEKYYVKVI